MMQWLSTYHNNSLETLRLSKMLDHLFDTIRIFLGDLGLDQVWQTAGRVNTKNLSKLEATILQLFDLHVGDCDVRQDIFFL